MNYNINNSAKCFVLTIENKLVGFAAVQMFPHPISPMRKVHRLVILPDYQGINLGSIFLEAIAEYFTDYPFAITTSQPALISCL